MKIKHFGGKYQQREVYCILLFLNRCGFQSSYLSHVQRVTDRESLLLFVYLFIRSGIQSPYLSHPLWLSNLPRPLSDLFSVSFDRSVRLSLRRRSVQFLMFLTVYEYVQRLPAGRERNMIKHGLIPSKLALSILHSSQYDCRYECPYEYGLYHQASSLGVESLSRTNHFCWRVSENAYRTSQKPQ